MLVPCKYLLWYLFIHHVTVFTVTGGLALCPELEELAAATTEALNRDANNNRIKFTNESSTVCIKKYGDDLNALLYEVIANKRREGRLTPSQFACELGCPSREPELEYVLERIQPYYRFEDAIKNCEMKLFPILIWISRNGRLRYRSCGSRVFGSKNFFESMRVWYAMIAGLLRSDALLPTGDILFGFDASDFATPTHEAPSDPTRTNGYVSVISTPVVRYVGTNAHHSFLFPTTSHLTAIGFHKVRIGTRSKNWLNVSTASSSSSTNGRNATHLFWRGLPTGVPWSRFSWRHHPRSRLIREFALGEPHFDVAFVRPPHLVEDAHNSTTMQREMEREWRSAAPILKERHADYAFLLHLDGNTASWGATHKLASGAVVLWAASPNGYREHFYRLLRPWDHFLPLSPDLADLRAARDLLLTSPEASERITSGTRELFARRLRPQDALCYMVRLVWVIHGLYYHHDDAADHEKRAEANESERLVREAYGASLEGFKDMEEERVYFSQGGNEVI